MRKIILFVIALFVAHTALGWGQKGHDVVAYIAEQHLSKKAAKKIDRVLDGHSPVYYANWMDNASNTPEYAYTKTWHYLNIDEGQTFETMPKNPDGDVLVAIESLVKELKAGNLTTEQEASNLKMLIHLVGDMHCPMHMGRLSDRGGNRCPVLFFGRATNMHAIWDTDVLESAHKWSYTEWQVQIDRVSKAERKTIEAGIPRMWAEQTYLVCSEIYGSTPEGMKVSYDYIAKYAPVIEQQLVRGGIRLAALLNEIYK